MNIKQSANGKELELRIAEYAKSAPEIRKAIERKMGELGLALLQVDSIPQLPNNMRRPSNYPDHLRADVNDDLRLYWTIKNREILVFTDVCNHKEAKKKYGDVHKA